MTRIATLAAAAVLAISTQTAGAAGVKWEKFMSNGSAAAAVAAAVAAVGNCSKPLHFEETAVDGEIQLIVSCRGGEDEEAAAIAKFQDFGDGTPYLLPMGFDYAG